MPATTAVTLLQSTTLGRQSLAAGCSVRVPPDVAQAWADAGVARFDRETASETEQAQDEAENMPLPLAPDAFVAMENVAQPEGEAAAPAPQKAKTAPQRKRGV